MKNTKMYNSYKKMLTGTLVPNNFALIAPIDILLQNFTLP